MKPKQSLARRNKLYIKRGKLNGLT